MSVQIAGLSGIDFTSLIDGLVQAERAPISQLEKRKSDANKQISFLSDLLTKLQALVDKTAGLDSSAEITPFKATSSEESRVTATAGSGASAGSYAVTVTHLASAESKQSARLAADVDGAAGTGTLSITVAGQSRDFAYGATDSLSDLAARINDWGAPVRAAVIYDGVGYRLTLTSRDTGLANAASAADSGTTLQLAQAMAARDAELSVNGVTVTRPGNEISDVIAGVSFTLKSEGAATVTVTRDTEALRKKVSELVDAYNEVAKLVRGQLRYDEQKDSQGTLFGDPALQRLQRQLGGALAASYAHGSGKISIGGLGIKLASDGTLSFDASKFDAAVAADPTAVTDLLAGSSGTGLALSLHDVLSGYTQSSTGVVAAKQTSLRTRIEGFDDQIDRIEGAAASLENRLRQQFSALDQLMSNLNTQSSYLAALLQ